MTSFWSYSPWLLPTFWPVNRAAAGNTTNRSAGGVKSACPAEAGGERNPIRSPCPYRCTTGYRPYRSFGCISDVRMSGEPMCPFLRWQQTTTRSGGPQGPSPTCPSVRQRLILQGISTHKGFCRSLRKPVRLRTLILPAGAPLRNGTNTSFECAGPIAPRAPPGA